ncbi:hypothetical protein AMD27_01845 [Acinetobacter sp. TGL-Y2]|uniref:hypothetical protein n=1 Tax=Acinetobacter sp. TGL-Y2 TaxID=1407071 RepID=UPI0007A65923|nr:hypothetical protein [Acinetobacter sp. TGL-Y2]AMW77756.1 hypothetical protein AMD27_01845 [Acinetobacter sp. TGL-Y2]
MIYKYFFTTLTSILLAGCSNLLLDSSTPMVLEQHKNISAQPETKHNLARLIKQSDNCVIEFTGNFQTGKATEYWIFKGDQLISAYTNLDTQAEDKQVIFHVNDPDKQKNFKSLKNNFSKKNLAKCD